MLFRKLVVVGLAGFFSLAANIATAEDAVGPTATFVGIDGVNFSDPSDAFPNRFQVSLAPGEERRFSQLGAGERSSSRVDREERVYELSVIAASRSGFDVAIAQRGGLGFNDQGDIERHSRASELRLGRGLREMPRDTPSATPKWYVFAASEDEALIWRPGMRTEFGSSGGGFALQDRVEIGDMQAGITYEANGWQTSLAYVEREVSVRTGHETFSEDERFVGVTLTMRH